MNYLTITFSEYVPESIKGTAFATGNTFFSSEDAFGIEPFKIPKGSFTSSKSIPYALSAPTTCSNVLRVIRSMQLRKPILLVILKQYPLTF